MYCRPTIVSQFESWFSGNTRSRNHAMQVRPAESSRNFCIEFRVSCQIHCTHATRTNFGDNAVVGQARIRGQFYHVCCLTSRGIWTQHQSERGSFWRKVSADFWQTTPQI